MKQDTERKISVEDLIRLKRAERPPAEFWATFEAEIRAKQLSAIVSRRPWWDRFSSVFVLLRRHQLSFGGATALVLTLAGVRYMGSHGEPVAPSQVAVVEHAGVALVPVHAPQAAAPAAARQEEVASGTMEVAAAPRTVVTTAASHLTQAPSAAVAVASSRSPFVDGIAITLSDFREPASDYAKPAVFGSDREFEAPPQARQQVVDPLARLDPAAERRARLLAPALPAYSGTQRTLASDWMRQKSSSDDRMYESMDRGSSDDRTLVGFRF